MVHPLALAPQTENTVGRAPVQVAEIITQRCANNWGCAPCRAGLGDVLDFGDSDLSQNFAQQGLGNWTVGNGTGTRIAGGVRVQGTAADVLVQRTGASGFSGDAFRYVVVHGKYTAGDLGDWIVFYASTAGAFSAGRAMNAVNLSREFRGVTLDALEPGDEFVAVFDAADSANYATDWQGDTIDGLRFDMGTTSADDFVIYSITVCSADPFATRGRECYRTRATCKDISNYRGKPDGHLDPTQVYFDGDTILAATYARTGKAYFTAKVRADITPSGTILALGSATNFLYLGVTGSNIVLAAGGNTAATQARATAATSTIAGRTTTLVAEIDYDADTVSLWDYCTVGCALTLLATGSASTALPALWAAATDGQVGTDGGNTYGTEDGGDWAGRIIEVRGHDGLLFDGWTGLEWTLAEYFGLPTGERPADRDKVIRPFLRDASTAPTKVSLAGSNRTTDPIGNRARLSLQLSEHPATDNLSDPYRSDRLHTALRQPGGFWARWRVRQKFGRRGARLIFYEGYSGQPLAGMAKREYVMEALDFPDENSVTITGRDILSKTQIERAQVPEQSPGLLDADISAAATACTVAGATVYDYPAPGWVRIENEIIAFSAVATNAGDPSKVDLTLSARGTDRSTPAAHETDESVQLCRRYTDASVTAVLTELTADDAEIPAQFLNLSDWATVEADFLSSYTMSALFTSPTSVAKLIGSLIESVASFIYWDERAQVVNLVALSALSATPPTITEADDIIADSFSIREKPKEQATRVQVFYDPADFSDKRSEPADFLSGYIDARLDLEGEDGYGIKQTRTILSEWLNTNAEATQTASRLANRYQDVPVEITFALDANDRNYWIGDVVRVRHSSIVDEFGDFDLLRNFLITSASEIVPGEIVAYTAEDSTLAGFIAFVTSNSQGDYTGDPDLDQQYGFISDANGLMSNGDKGAIIT